jgi:hypothetical protein
MVNYLGFVISCNGERHTRTYLGLTVMWGTIRKSLKEEQAE